MIQLKDVSFGYGGVPILEDVSLDLPAGSFHFLTGPSGSGKTTLLKLCYMELAPGSGQVDIFGSDAGALSRDDVAMARQRIGIVHQDCDFVDHLSVSENIALPLVAAGRDPETERENIEELLNWTGLGPRTNALPPELSGGERQRAALARAVVMSPEVILADEPTGNVDWEMSERLLTLLVQLNKMGKTVLLATHDLGLIRAAKSQVQARVLRLKGGRLMQAGTDL